jgi:hypothetical protein
LTQQHLRRQVDWCVSLLPWQRRVRSLLHQVAARRRNARRPLKRGRACKATRERSEQTQLCEETLAHTAQAFALQFAAHLARMTRIVFLNRILRSLPFEHFCGVDGVACKFATLHRRNAVDFKSAVGWWRIAQSTTSSKTRTTLSSHIHSQSSILNSLPNLRAADISQVLKCGARARRTSSFCIVLYGAKFTRFSLQFCWLYAQTPVFVVDFAQLSL